MGRADEPKRCVSWLELIVGQSAPMQLHSITTSLIPKYVPREWKDPEYNWEALLVGAENQHALSGIAPPHACQNEISHRVTNPFPTKVVFEIRKTPSMHMQISFAAVLRYLMLHQ